jgi:hypothetical protein
MQSSNAFWRWLAAPMRQLFDGGPALLRGQRVMACRDEAARAKVLLDLYVLAPADHMRVDDTHVLL